MSEFMNYCIVKCIKCKERFTVGEHTVYECTSRGSDHYGHFISENHKICANSVKKEEEE